MKRSDFFKTLGLGITGAVVAPSLLREIESVKEHVKTDEGIKQAEEVKNTNYKDIGTVKYTGGTCFYEFL